VSVIAGSFESCRPGGNGIRVTSTSLVLFLKTFVRKPRISRERSQFVKTLEIASGKARYRLRNSSGGIGSRDRDVVTEGDVFGRCSTRTIVG